MQKKYENTKWIFLTISGILLISIFVFRRYLFQGYYFFSLGMLSDLIRANVPTYYQLYDSIANGGIYWSWKMGIGTSMFTHADVYFDPFTYIVFLLGRNGIPQMMLWVLIIKILAQAICIFSYLNYFKLNKYAVFIGSITYAFCGYSLITGSNLALGTILVYAPLVLKGIEKWLNERKIFLMIFSLFLTCIYSYYYFYAMGLLACGYLIIRLIQKKRKILPYLIILGICGIITILLGAFSLWPQIELIINTPRVSGQSDVATGTILFIPQIKVLFTSLTRIMGNELLGNPVTSLYYGCAFNGSCDFFQTTTYSSAFFIILSWNYWINEQKQRKNFLMIIMILSLMVMLPVVSFAFNAFSTINTRWMFIFSILETLLISLSLDTIIRNKGVKLKVLLQGILFSYLFIFITYIAFSIGTVSFKWSFLNNLLIPRKFIYMITILYCGLLCIWACANYKKIPENIKKPLLNIGIFLLIALDIAGNYYHWYSSGDAVCSYSEETNSSYEDTSAKIIRQLKINDTSLYRIHKDFDSVYDNNQIPSENDAMVQGYYGLKSYNSINNPAYIQFLQEVGIYVCCPLDTNYLKEAGIQPEEITGQALNYIDGVENDIWLMDYLGVKYFISKNNSALDESYRYLFKENEINVFINENAYPLAFVNENLMHYDDFKELTDSDKRLALLFYTIVYDDADITESQYINLSQFDLTDSVSRKNSAFSLLEFTENEVSFSIEVPKDNQYISMSIPFDKNWHIFVDGNEVSAEKINISLLGARVNSGTHTITLKYVPSMFFWGIAVSILTLLILLIFFFINKKFNIINNRIHASRVFYCHE